MAKTDRPLEKIDVKKTHPDLYRATARVGTVRAPRGTFLACDGVGAPGGPDYQEAIGTIFTVAYTAKFALKGAGVVDFAIPALECLWFGDPSATPRDEWRWRLLVRIPDRVTARDLQPIRQAIREKKGLDTSSIRRVTWSEGLALQTLHVGPYDTVCDAYDRLTAAARDHGFECVGTGHEIYLSDPRRVAPEKIKTIVRLAVRKPAGRASVARAV